jgi:hypothetical protein
MISYPIATATGAFSAPDADGSKSRFHDRQGFSTSNRPDIRPTSRAGAASNLMA